MVRPGVGSIPVHQTQPEDLCASAECASGQVSCNGAGAVPPAILAEFTIVANGQDTFNVNNVVR